MAIVDTKIRCILAQFLILIIFIMAKGKVRFFNETKGIGFITSSEDGSDIFVHISGLIDLIRDNDEVEYDIERGKKGPNAIKVRRVF